MPPLLVAVMAGVVGLVLGSFANVPIHRWPRQESVTRPRRSVCPSCRTPIRAVDNVPVVSWLFLRGRCRDCGERISVRYPIVEAATGVLFAWVGWVYATEPLLLLAMLVMTWSLVVATAIDLEHQIIPNRLTYRLPFVLLPLLVAHAATIGAWASLRRAVIAGLGLALGMFLLAELFRLLRGQMGMGMGDVKLGVSLGLIVGYLGGIHLVAFGYATIISSVTVAGTLIVLGRAKMASRIPFGPYLAIGAMVTILFPIGSAEVVGSVLGF